MYTHVCMYTSVWHKCMFQSINLFYCRPNECLAYNLAVNNALRNLIYKREWLYVLCAYYFVSYCISPYASVCLSVCLSLSLFPLQCYIFIRRSPPAWSTISISAAYLHIAKPHPPRALSVCVCVSFPSLSPFSPHCLSIISSSACNRCSSPLSPALSVRPSYNYAFLCRST